MEYTQTQTRRAADLVGPSKPGRSPPTAVDWDRHKERIRDLYINQKRTLKNVVQIMRDEHKFFAT
jgi:hypothetical protein